MAGLAHWCFWLALSYRVAFAAFAGPYWMKVREFENCPKKEIEMEMKFCDMCASCRMRHNRTLKIPVLDLNMTLANGVMRRGESTMTLDIARWDTVSGWRNHFLVMSLGELCFVYEDIATDVVKVLAEIGGVPTKCPISDGFYSGTNANARIMALRHFPTLPYGRYRVYTMINFAKPPRTLRSCLKVVADVVPKT